MGAAGTAHVRIWSAIDRKIRWDRAWWPPRWACKAVPVRVAVPGGPPGAAPGKLLRGCLASTMRCLPLGMGATWVPIPPIANIPLARTGLLCVGTMDRWSPVVPRTRLRYTIYIYIVALTRYNVYILLLENNTKYNT